MTLAVTALLAASVGPVAAAELPGKQSENARKALILLGNIGLDSKEMRELVQRIEDRPDRRYLPLAEEKVVGGKLTLHYELSGVRGKNLELRYSLDNSNWMATARTSGVMVSYRLKF